MCLVVEGWAPVVVEGRRVPTPSDRRRQGPLTVRGAPLGASPQPPVRRARGALLVRVPYLSAVPVLGSGSGQDQGTRNEAAAAGSGAEARHELRPHLSSYSNRELVDRTRPGARGQGVGGLGSPHVSSRCTRARGARGPGHPRRARARNPCPLSDRTTRPNGVWGRPPGLVVNPHGDW